VGSDPRGGVRLLTTADSITAFTQRDPAEGQPGTERTVVRILAASDGLSRPDRSARRTDSGTGRPRYSSLDTSTVESSPVTTLKPRRSKTAIIGRLSLVV